MPISIAKLEAAQRPLSDQIFQFLLGRPDQAFTWTEIYAGLTGANEQFVELAMLLAAPQDNDTPARWKKALGELVEGGKVQTAKVGGQDYYGIKK